ncbi:impB/mucB/samB family/impB/mucB/samB family C-terminal domain containing protein, putative [Angomonas deanei]|uniref:ImpB/mucB/samB family/impB/mucB/samB family C-terminal domain containing protein, putative n=1 Tax=Angomonas deanei TaxID=59799 RepID=A0A7G2CIV9_9TRYP|nr:impB/mucB/samB family/impB/mucB/samB family C-terminal domain containing protein, putative [Angomonas deanei]
MDVTDYLNNFYEKNKFRISAEQICSDFREEVLLKTNLTCSGGVALTPTLAKLASNINKPNGQHVMEFKNKKDMLAFVHELSLRQVPGIGLAQEQILNALGVTKCGDLLTHKYRLFYLFKEKSFLNYLSIGLGLLGQTTHVATNKKNNELRQSLGKESSFSDPLPSKEAFRRLFRSLLETVHVQCVKEKLFAQQMKLVLKYRTFDTKQYSISLDRPTNDLKLFLEAGEKLLAPHLSHYAELRLVGVRLQKMITMEDYLKKAKETKQIPTAKETGMAPEKKRPAATTATGAAVDEFGDTVHPRHDDGKHLDGTKAIKYTPPHLNSAKEKKSTTPANKKKQLKRASKSKKK